MGSVLGSKRRTRGVCMPPPCRQRRRVHHCSDALLREKEHEREAPLETALACAWSRDHVLSFLTMHDAATGLRAASRGCRDAVAAAEWMHLGPRPIQHLAAWHTAFPHARAAAVTYSALAYALAADVPSAFAHLRHLDVSGCNELVWDTMLTPLVPQLEELCVRGCWTVTDAGIARLVNLRKLDMSCCSQLTDAALAPLHKLTSLKIARCWGVSDAALVPLVALTKLSLEACHHLTDAVLAPVAARLTSLDITQCRSISADAVQRVRPLHTLRAARSCLADAQPVLAPHQAVWARHAPTLRKLDITGCRRVEADSIAACTQLVCLLANQCVRLTDAALAPLRHLTHLGVADCAGVSDATLLALAPTLRMLDVSGCVNVSDVGLAALTRLTALRMSGCHQITDAGLAPLVHLVHLEMAGCSQITDAAFLNLTNLETVFATPFASISEHAFVYTRKRVRLL